MQNNIDIAKTHR